jgi:hypothetical protein
METLAAWKIIRHRMEVCPLSFSLSLMVLVYHIQIRLQCPRLLWNRIALYCLFSHHIVCAPVCDAQRGKSRKALSSVLKELRSLRQQYLRAASESDDTVRPCPFVCLLLLQRQFSLPNTSLLMMVIGGGVCAE